MISRVLDVKLDGLVMSHCLWLKGGVGSCIGNNRTKDRSRRDRDKNMIIIDIGECGAEGREKEGARVTEKRNGD